MRQGVLKQNNYLSTLVKALIRFNSELWQEEKIASFSY